MKAGGREPENWHRSHGLVSQARLGLGVQPEDRRSTRVNSSLFSIDKALRAKGPASHADSLATPPLKEGDL